MCVSRYDADSSGGISCAEFGKIVAMVARHDKKTKTTKKAAATAKDLTDAMKQGHGAVSVPVAFGAGDGVPLLSTPPARRRPGARSPQRSPPPPAAAIAAALTGSDSVRRAAAGGGGHRFAV